MNTKHTPGPWEPIERPDGTVWIQGPAHDDNNWREVCSMPIWPSRSREIEQANAALIAAAPELLSALTAAEQALSDAIEGGPHWRLNAVESDIPKIRAAIAKAKGNA